MAAPLTHRVVAVEGHSVALREADGQLHMGRFVGRGPDGASLGPVEVPATPYYDGHIASGALALAPELPPAAPAEVIRG